MANRFMVVRIAVFVFAFSCFLSSAHSEVEVNHEERLQKLFENIISRYKKLYNSDNGISFSLDGEVIVKNNGSSYAIILPNLSINSSELVIDLGKVSFTASPGETDKLWNLSYQLPSSIPITDAQGQRITTVSIGKQSSTGVFHEDVLQFKKLNSVLKDVSLDEAADIPAIKISEIITKFDYTHTPQQRWSGPGFFEMKGISINSIKDQSSIKIGGFKAAFEMDQYDPFAMVSLQDKFFSALPSGDYSQSKQDAAKRDLLSQELINSILTSVNGMKYRYEISNLLLSNIKLTKEKRGDLKLNEASMSMEWTDMFKDKSNVGMAYGYKGFDLSFMEESVKDVLPSNINFSLAVKQFPHKDFISIYKDLFSSFETLSEQQKKEANTALMLKFLPLLSKANSILQFQNIYANHIYSIDIKGGLAADDRALFKFIGQLSGSFSGLDAVLERATQLTETVDAEEIAKIKSLVTSLEQMKILKKVIDPTSSEPIHVVDVKVNREGQLIINGEDLSALMGLLPRKINKNGSP